MTVELSHGPQDESSEEKFGIYYKHKHDISFRFLFYLFVIETER